MYRRTAEMALGRLLLRCLSLSVVVFGLVVFFSFNNARLSVLYPDSVKLQSPAVTASAGDAIRQAFAPAVLPVSAGVFHDADGIAHKLPRKRHFSAPLGRKVCILDVDSRPMTGKGQLLNGAPINWKNGSHLTAGILSHYLYASIHGYDYKLVHPDSLHDRRDTWVKLPAIVEALRTHQMVVFMDADVVFTYPEIPIEWLMNLWNISPRASISMALDPDINPNYDRQGRVMQNAGFIIAQQSQRTQQIMKSWIECPDDEANWPGCARWKKEWADEQAAFANHIRYRYRQPDDVVEIPCAYANGCPQSQHMGNCTGTFVRHYWYDKNLAKPWVEQSLVSAFMPALHGHFLKGLVDNVSFE